jgi:hypothetical protein
MVVQCVLQALEQPILADCSSLGKLLRQKANLEEAMLEQLISLLSKGSEAAAIALRGRQEVVERVMPLAESTNNKAAKLAIQTLLPEGKECLSKELIKQFGAC